MCPCMCAVMCPCMLARVPLRAVLLCALGGAAPAHIIYMPSPFVCVYQSRSFQAATDRRRVWGQALWGYRFSRSYHGVRSFRSVGTKSCTRQFSSTSLNQVYALLVAGVGAACSKCLASHPTR
jgi:hypothetical protein